LIRELLIGPVLDSGQDKCVKNHTLFALLIKKLVSTVLAMSVGFTPLTY